MNNDKSLGVIAIGNEAVQRITMGETFRGCASAPNQAVFILGGPEKWGDCANEQTDGGATATAGEAASNHDSPAPGPSSPATTRRHKSAYATAPARVDGLGGAGKMIIVCAPATPGTAYHTAGLRDSLVLSIASRTKTSGEQALVSYEFAVL